MQIFFVMLLFATSSVMVGVQAIPARQPLAIVLTTERPSFISGDAIPVKVELTNISNKNLNVGSWVDLNSGVLFSHLFEVRNAAGEVVVKKTYPKPQTDAGSAWGMPEENSTGPEIGNVILLVLKPGEKFTIVEDVSRLYVLTVPGKYTIQMSHLVPGKSKDKAVNSNVIAITVERGGPPFQPAL
jgi:hypothetical protein